MAQRETVSVKQAITMVTMFILGTTFLVSAGLEAREDIWIAYLLSLAASLVLVCMYARMMSLRPGKDIFGVLEDVLGRPLSILFLVLMTIYLFQHYAYVLRHFSEYIFIAGGPGTPLVVSFISMGILSAIAVYSGIEVLGKWSELFILFVAVFVIAASLLLTKNMNINHLRPALENGIKPIAKGTWMLVSFPFGQILAFLFVLPPFADRKAPYKVFTIGLLAGAALIFLSSLTNVLVLGVKSVERLYYPTYSALAIIRMGDFIQRLEIVATTIFTIAIFLKAAILLMGVMRCMAYILRLETHGFIIAPVVLLAINYGFNAYGGNLQHHTGIATYVPYWSTLFQIIIPGVFFILLELKHRRKSKELGIPGRGLSKADRQG